jgi:endonuclease YncB( thermonuclease family)
LHERLLCSTGQLFIYIAAMRSPLYAVALTLLWLFAKSQFVYAQQLSGKVIKVTDGDTFTMLVNGNRQVKVRLHGIDAPEKGQPFGKNAQQYLSQLIYGKSVTVDSSGRDRYKRILGIVRTEAFINVNESMLRAGMAWHFKKYDQNPVWSQLESDARRMKRGLWVDSQAVAPWVWRK